ncbi:T9SS type A sorting domain-containing protein [Empedobacter sedimenti]|uniref:T9SS type A sorting domain-containing protein n=1 Tax=Empedobacter sedimenti TaxID=3042610 RepID=UPI0024A62FDB|nr:T9SS type A sorting domain-containing protein [Empedobacter sedimenti]
MKKIYSLLAIAALSTLSFAQTNVLIEDFNVLNLGGNTTSSGATSPDATDLYGGKSTLNLVNFPKGSKAYSAGGMVKLGSGSAIGNIDSKPLDLSTDKGNVKVVVDVKGWTITPAKFDINLIDSSGKIYATKSVDYKAVMSGATEKFTINFTGGLANTTVQIITNTDAFRVFVDNLVITTEPALATADYNKEVKAVTNTLWTNTATFSVKEKSIVEIYNLNGQLVKSFEINGIQNVDVSDLVKGTYVVKTSSNGKSSTQKVIKK